MNPTVLQNPVNWPPAIGKIGRWRRRLLWLGVIVLVALLARLVGFRGPPQPPSPLPVVRFIDLHTHTAGLGAGGSGCLVSPVLQSSYKFNLYLKAYGTTRTELELTAAQVQAIAAETNAWDRDVLFKHALGVPAEVFSRSATWLRLPRH